MRLLPEERLRVIDYIKELRDIRGADKDVMYICDELSKIFAKKRGRKVGWRKYPEE